MGGGFFAFLVFAAISIAVIVVLIDLCWFVPGLKIILSQPLLTQHFALEKKWDIVSGNSNSETERRDRVLRTLNTQFKP